MVAELAKSGRLTWLGCFGSSLITASSTLQKGELSQRRILIQLQELHVHLDGAFDHDFLFHAAREKLETLPVEAAETTSFVSCDGLNMGTK